MYAADLSYVHDVRFGRFAERVAPELIRQLRRRYGRRRGRVVEIGCGGGILARRLVDAGYSVFGIDASPAMVRLARSRVPEARFRVGALESARIPRCEAIFAVGEAVTYVTGGLSALRRFFARAHRALTPGGLLAFDFLESAERRTYPPRSFAGADWAMVVRADVNPTGRVLTRRMTVFRKVGDVYRRSQETHRVRIYPRAEIADALERAGFSVSMRRSYGPVRLLPGDVAAVAQKL